MTGERAEVVNRGTVEASGAGLARMLLLVLRELVATGEIGEAEIGTAVGAAMEPHEALGGAVLAGAVEALPASLWQELREPARCRRLFDEVLADVAAGEAARRSMSLLACLHPEVGEDLPELLAGAAHSGLVRSSGALALLEALGVEEGGVRFFHGLHGMPRAGWGPRPRPPKAPAHD